jgi:hypothetical protein
MLANYYDWNDLGRIIGIRGRAAVCCLHQPSRRKREQVFDILWAEARDRGFRVDQEFLPDGDVRYWAAPYAVVAG